VRFVVLVLKMALLGELLLFCLRVIRVQSGNVLV
jgi:hypothetical protein